MPTSPQPSPPSASGLERPNEPEWLIDGDAADAIDDAARAYGRMLNNKALEHARSVGRKAESGNPLISIEDVRAASAIPAAAPDDTAKRAEIVAKTPSAEDLASIAVDAEPMDAAPDAERIEAAAESPIKLRCMIQEVNSVSGLPMWRHASSNGDLRAALDDGWMDVNGWEPVMRPCEVPCSQPELALRQLNIDHCADEERIKALASTVLGQSQVDGDGYFVGSVQVVEMLVDLIRNQRPPATEGGQRNSVWQRQADALKTLSAAPSDAHMDSANYRGCCEKCGTACMDMLTDEVCFGCELARLRQEHDAALRAMKLALVTKEQAESKLSELEKIAGAARTYVDITNNYPQEAGAAWRDLCKLVLPEIYTESP